jgi:hypothetical protein
MLLFSYGLLPGFGPMPRAALFGLSAFHCAALMAEKPSVLYIEPVTLNEVAPIWPP